MENVNEDTHCPDCGTKWEDHGAHCPATTCDNCGIDWDEHSQYCGMTKDNLEQFEQKTRLDGTAGTCATCSGVYSDHPDEYDGHAFVPSSRKGRKTIEQDPDAGEAFLSRNFHDRRKNEGK
jgi:hypothetical protein